MNERGGKNPRNHWADTFLYMNAGGGKKIDENVAPARSLYDCAWAINLRNHLPACAFFECAWG